MCLHVKVRGIGSMFLQVKVIRDWVCVLTNESKRDWFYVLIREINYRLGLCAYR